MGKGHNEASKRRKSDKEEGRCSSISFSTPNLAFLTLPSLTVAQMALRAQVRSEGGVRIQFSASILKEGRLVLRLSSTPWLTLTPTFTRNLTSSPLSSGSTSPLTRLTSTSRPKFLPSPLLFGKVANQSAPIPSESTTSGACPPRTSSFTACRFSLLQYISNGFSSL